MKLEQIYQLNPLENAKDKALIKLKTKVLGGSDALEFTAALQPAKDLGVKSVIADLSDVDVINSSGLGMLVSGMSLLRKSNINFIVVGVPPKVMNLLEVTHLDRVFKILPDTNSALNI